MAAPHVAGVAAMYLSKNPGASPADVKRVLVEGATQGKLGSPESLLGTPDKIVYSLIDAMSSTAGN